jgi:hypothetical protein
MFDINLENIKQLLEAGIPVDDYARAADAVQDFEEFVETGDPVKDFREMILLLNENEALHPDLSNYCDRYQVQYKEMDPFVVQLPDDFEY